MPQERIHSRTFRIIEPSVRLSRILGQFPVNYRKDGDFYVIKTSLGWFFYSYLFLFGMIHTSIIGVFQYLVTDTVTAFIMRDKKNKFITTCDVGIVMLNMISGVISAPWRIRKFFILLKHFDEMDYFLPQINIEVYRRKSIMFITGVYFLYILLILYYVTMWGLQISSHYYKGFKGIYIYQLVLISQHIFFWNLVYIINIKLNILNSYLRTRKHNKKLLDKLMINIYVDTLFIDSSVNIVEDQIQFKKKRMGMHYINNEKRIMILLKFYKIIISSVNLLNNTASNGVMFIMLSGLIHLIATSYYLLLELMKEDREKMFVVLQVIWLCVHLGRLLIIVEPCQYGIEEGEKTVALIHELQSQKCISKDFRTALDIFITQVTQQPIKFSCNSLFKIDRSIITTLVGAITTYIVILFQFNNN